MKAEQARVISASVQEALTIIENKEANKQYQSLIDCIQGASKIGKRDITTEMKYYNYSIFRRLLMDGYDLSDAVRGEVRISW